MVLCPVCPMYSIPAVTVILSPLTQFAAVKIHLKNSKSNIPIQCYWYQAGLDTSIRPQWNFHVYTCQLLMIRRISISLLLIRRNVEIHQWHLIVHSKCAIEHWRHCYEHIAKQTKLSIAYSWLNGGSFFSCRCEANHNHFWFRLGFG